MVNNSDSSGPIKHKIKLIQDLMVTYMFKRGSRYLSQGGSHQKRTRLIIRYFDFRISMDVSLLQEKSTFPVLTMRMSPHLEPFFFLIYDCILHKCWAISNQYHFTNPISTFLPKFQGGSGPPVPPSGSAHDVDQVCADWLIFVDASM